MKKSRKQKEHMNNISNASAAAVSLSPPNAESWVRDDSVSRRGFPFRGFEEPARDAGFFRAAGGLGGAAAVLPVRWFGEVAWRKKVQVAKS